MPLGLPMDDEYWRFERLDVMNASEALKSLAGSSVGVRQFMEACKQELQGRFPLFTQQVTHEEIVDALYNIEMGRLCYYLDSRLKQEDLLCSIRDRKLVPVRNTRRSLATVLEKADDAPSFSKMSELSPELREIIYEEYIADLDVWKEHGPSLHYPCHPPLASTSRQYRIEVLPIFYKRGEFMLDCSWNYGRDKHGV